MNIDTDELKNDVSSRSNPWEFSRNLNPSGKYKNEFFRRHKCLNPECITASSSNIRWIVADWLIDLTNPCVSLETGLEIFSLYIESNFEVMSKSNESIKVQLKF